MPYVHCAARVMNMYITSVLTWTRSPAHMWQAFNLFDGLPAGTIAIIIRSALRAIEDGHACNWSCVTEDRLFEFLMEQRCDMGWNCHLVERLIEAMMLHLVLNWGGPQRMN